MGQPDGDAAVSGDRRRRRVPEDVQERLRARAELRRHRPRHRRVRAHAGVSRRAVRRLRRREAQGDLARRAGGLGAVQRQGALRDAATRSTRPIRSAATTASTTSASSARHKDFEKLAGKALATLAKDDGPDAVDKLALVHRPLGARPLPRVRSSGPTSARSRPRSSATSRSPAPYMHDGSMQTLWDVMDHYNKGGEANAYLDGGIEPLALSETEIDQLVAFMFALTDRRFQAQSDAAVREPAEARAATTRPFRDNALAQRKMLPFEERVMASRGEGELIMRRPRGVKSIETKHKEERDAFFRGLAQSRPPLLPEGVDRRRGRRRRQRRRPAPALLHADRRGERARPNEGFRIAYISDSHLYEREGQRALRALADARRGRRQQARPAAGLRPLRRRPRPARRARASSTSARRFSRT